MILRRVIAHFKKQEWTAIAIDFLIVVVGVFVGLQVNNWNIAQAEQRREAFYLQRLHSDLDALEATAYRLDKSVAGRVAGADRVLDAVYGRDMTVTALDAQACDSIARLHIFYLEGSALPALDELIASGQFGLISDQALLKALSDYLSFARAMPARADAVSARAPILRQEFPSAITARAAIVDGVRTVTNECNLAAMQSDPAFLNALTEVHERAGFFQRRFLAPERALVERIHIELDRVLAIDHAIEAIK